MMSKPRNVVLVIDSLVDLLSSNLLPDVKLVAFDNQPHEESTSDSTLVQWYFEDLLKKEYASFIDLLEVYLNQ